MPTYATADELRADPAVPDAIPPTDAELDNKLLEAEDWIDRISGARSVDTATGRKFTPSVMAEGTRATLARATVILAVELYKDANVFTPTGHTKISGPDFTVEGMDGANVPAAGALVIRRVAALLDVHHLRVLRAYT